MKALLFNIYVSRVLVAVLVLANFIAPWEKGVILQFNIFNTVVCIFWLITLYSQTGHFLKQVSETEDGKVQYEYSIPTIQVVVVRLVQLIYYALLRSSIINWPVVIGLIAGDIVTISYMLFDKSSYYYESEEIQNGN